MSDELITNESPEVMPLEEILAELKQPYTGKLPKEALRAAQARRDEIIPHLIKILDDAVSAAKAGDKTCAESQRPFFALYLLAEFRAKEALPVIREALTLPDDFPDLLFGDAITEDLPRILAVLADDKVDWITECIDNDQIDLYVRWSMANVYLHLVADAKMSREEAMERLRRHLIRVMDKGDWEFTTSLVCVLSKYSPHEAKAEIELAFAEDLIETFQIDESFVDESLEGGEAWFQKSIGCQGPSGIQDTVEVLSRWAGYEERPPQSEADRLWKRDEDTWSPPTRSIPTYEPPPPFEAVKTIRNTEPRIGRNDPCPCGSGKKYKKCCGKP